MASSSSLCALCWVLILTLGFRSCRGFGTFGFDVHHRYSDPVKGIMAVDDLPEKGSVPYYAAMTHRDHLIHGRGLATAADTPLTFADGNQTFQISYLGFLHYANISVGTPSSWFLVALDTGSDLFWLPCDCTSCVHGLSASSGDTLDLNIYSPNTSSTSTKVTCNSTMCAQQRRCSTAGSDCPYQVLYLSNGTSSTGILVEDVLRLTTDDAQSKAVDAPITFGCGKVQTGSFLDGAAPNGLFGLGMENISVPSTLANKGLASNSFSLCFGPDGTGRINFGDKGTSDQGETPFNIRQLNPTYNVSVTQIIVGGNAADLEFGAIFDSGTSFTYLNDPAYTLISESFNSLVNEKRSSSNPNIPFEYCYDLSANQTSFSVPRVNLTMKGGDIFDVTDPIVVISTRSGSGMYCLGVVKSGDINIIGQNFMTGYKIVFDREKMILGWKASNCYDNVNSNTPPISPTSSRAIPPPASSRASPSPTSSRASPPPTSSRASPPPTSSRAIPPAVAVNPEATSGSDNNTDISGAPQPMTGHSAHLTCAFVTVLFTILAIV